MESDTRKSFLSLIQCLFVPNQTFNKKKEKKKPFRSYLHCSPRFDMAPFLIPLLNKPPCRAKHMNVFIRQKQDEERKPS